MRSRAVSLPLACWAVDPLLAAAEAGAFAALFEAVEDVFHDVSGFLRERASA